MEIEINDVNALLEQSGDLAQYASNILNVQEELTSASQKIANNWPSDTVDKESYLKALNENLNKISTLVTAIQKLSQTLTVYAESYQTR